MTERLLVLGGSRQAVGGLEQLRQDGYELVVCDVDPDAPGFNLADYGILGSVYHIDDCLPAIEGFHTQKPLDGVMCLACDVPHVVARIADRLGLSGLPIEVADRAVDKIAMKERFVLDKVPVPFFKQVASVDEIRTLQQEQDTEFVVKPVDSRGSKGVSRLARSGDVDWAFSYAKENSPTERVMVEAYLPGPQISSETVVIDGKAVTPALSDRSYEYLEKYYPFIVENGGDMPSALPAETLEKTRLLIEKAAKSLGVQNGVVKGDIVVSEGTPYMIELAARLSGGYFCTHQIPLSTGVKLVSACAQIALGKQLQAGDWHPRYEKPVSTRWKLLEPGRVLCVPDESDVLESPGVRYFEHWLTVGDEIGNAQNAAASVAMVQATGDTRRQSIENAENALERFNPEIQPF